MADQTIPNRRALLKATVPAILAAAALPALAKGVHTVDALHEFDALRPSEKGFALAAARLLRACPAAALAAGREERARLATTGYACGWLSLEDAQMIGGAA